MRSLISTGSLNGPEYAQSIAADLLKAIPRVFPACTDWSITQTCRQKKDESVADFKARLEVLLLWHSGCYTINKATQPALVPLFLIGLSSEISGLIKTQKLGWVVISLAELRTIAEHFGRTLEQDHK